MARSCADLLPPGASIPRLQCFPAMGVTVTAAFCWRDGPAGFLPVGEGPLTVPVVRLRGFPVLQRDHCRLKGAMPSPKAYLVVLLFPGMSYHPRHTCMAIRWHKNATGTSPGLEPGSRRQSPRSRGNHRGPWGPPHRGGSMPPYGLRDLACCFFGCHLRLGVEARFCLWLVVPSTGDAPSGYSGYPPKLIWS